MNGLLSGPTRHRPMGQRDAKLQQTYTKLLQRDTKLQERGSKQLQRDAKQPERDTTIKMSHKITSKRQNYNKQIQNDYKKRQKQLLRETKLKQRGTK